MFGVVKYNTFEWDEKKWIFPRINYLFIKDYNSKRI